MVVAFAGGLARSGVMLLAGSILRLVIVKRLGFAGIVVEARDIFDFFGGVSCQNFPLTQNLHNWEIVKLFELLATSLCSINPNKL